MATPGIRVEGAARLRKTLLDAGASLDDLKAVNERIADYLVPLIVARTPRGPTGRLAASVRGSGTKTASYTRAGRKSVPYAKPIHWGWPKRHIRPQPFAWEVVNAYRESWEGMYEDEVDHRLSAVKGV